MPGAIAAAGSIAAAGIGYAASSGAANTMSGASKQATYNQLAMFQLGYNTMHPWVDSGDAARSQLQDLTQPGGYLSQVYNYQPYTGPGVPTAPTIAPYSGPGVNMNVPVAPTLDQFNPTMAQLQAMPGYQFEQAEGLKAIQSANAAKGLGVSGAAMQQAGQFAQGLASQDLMNYYNQWLGNQNMKLAGYNAQMSQYGAGLGAQNQAYNQWLQGGNLQLAQYQQALAGQQAGFNEWQTGQINAANVLSGQQTNLYNRLAGQSQLGESAAAGTAGNAQAAGANMATTQLAGAQAQAQGQMAAANQITSGINSLTTPYYNPQTGTMQSPLGQAYNQVGNWFGGGSPSIAATGANTAAPWAFGGALPTGDTGSAF